MTRLIRRLSLVLLLVIATAAPAQARVTIAFWSQELGTSFPHAFFTVKGVPEAGGEPVDGAYGFTAKAVTPAILLGNVPGRIDYPTDGYVKGSNVHFSLEISDAQYRNVMQLIEQWGEKGDHHYNLNRRNCIHFVAEAMRRSGLAVTEPKKLMKKPRSFSQFVADANRATVRRLELPAERYFALLEQERGAGRVALAK